MEKFIKEKMKRDKDYEWFMFPQSYLTSTIILCDWFLKTYQHDQYGDGHKEKFFYKFNSPEYLIFPAVYNLKHGLELYLKSLSRLCDKSYNQKEHDLKKLFDELIEKLKKYNDIPNTLENSIKGIVEKYCKGAYTPFVFEGKKPDYGNQAERYPEHNTYCLPDNFSFDEKGNIKNLITPKLITEIRNDAEKSCSELRKIQNTLLAKKNSEETWVINKKTL